MPNYPSRLNLYDAGNEHMHIPRAFYCAVRRGSWVLRARQKELISSIHMGRFATDTASDFFSARLEIL